MSPSTRAVIMQWSWYVPTSTTTAAWPQHLVSLHVTHQSSILLCPVSRGIVRDHDTFQHQPLHHHDSLAPAPLVTDRQYSRGIQKGQLRYEDGYCPSTHVHMCSDHIPVGVILHNDDDWDIPPPLTTRTTIPLFHYEKKIIVYIIYNHRDERQWHNLSADICLPSI